MRAGRLRHRLKVYTLSGSSDQFGAIDNTYTLLKTVPAKYTIREISEGPKSGDRVSRVTVKATVRYQPDLAALPSTAEFEIDGKRFNLITTTDPTGQRRNIEIFGELLS